jgi:hypothetical protein
MAQVLGREALQGLVVRHRCDQPLCFRFDHLLVGTVADNARDMMDRGRGRGQREPLHGKLSAKDVLDIRQRLVDGESMSSVARHYEVNRTTILAIREGRTHRTSLRGEATLTT